MDNDRKREVLNELRSEMLDRRAARLNRWLQVVGLVLTFFAVGVTVVGILGFQRFEDLELRTRRTFERLEDRARDSLARVEKHEEAAGDLRKKLDQLAEDLDLDQLTESLGEMAMALPGITEPGSLFRTAMGLEEFQTVSGSLEDDRSERRTFSLPVGEYWFAGTCDFGCGDLDLRLYERDTGEFLNEDILVDDVPVLRHQTTEPVGLDVDIVMVDCVADECDWSVTVYRRGQED